MFCVFFTVHQMEKKSGKRKYYNQHNFRKSAGCDYMFCCNGNGTYRNARSVFNIIIYGRNPDRIKLFHIQYRNKVYIRNRNVDYRNARSNLQSRLGIPWHRRNSFLYSFNWRNNNSFGNPDTQYFTKIDNQFLFE